jgi:TPR repeat protein
MITSWRLRIFLCGAFTFLYFSGLMAATFADGQSAFDRGDYINARRILNTNPLKENPMACIYLQAMGEDQRPRGMDGFWEFVRTQSADGNKIAKIANAQRRLRHGMDSPDYADGVERLSRMADEGFAPAAFFLGLHYEEGVRLPRSYERALERYVQAGDLLMAQYKRARLLLDGLMPGRQPEGLALLRESATRGFAEAQFKISTAYYAGTLGLAQDRQEAYRWCGLAAEQSYGPALMALGNHYAKEADGVDRTIASYRRAGEAGEHRAWIKLEDYMRTHMGEMIPSPDVLRSLGQRDIDLTLREHILKDLMDRRERVLDPNLKVTYKSFLRSPFVSPGAKITLAQSLLQHPLTPMEDIRDLLMDPNLKGEDIKRVFMERWHHHVAHGEIEKAKDYILALCDSAWDIRFTEGAVLGLLERLTPEIQYQVSSALLGKYGETLNTEPALKRKVEDIINLHDDPVLSLRVSLQDPARRFLANLEAQGLKPAGLSIIRLLTTLPEDTHPTTRAPIANKKAVFFLERLLNMSQRADMAPADKERHVFLTLRALQYSIKPCVIPTPDHVPAELQVNEAFFNDPRIILANHLTFADQRPVDEVEYRTAVDSLVARYIRLENAGQITDEMRMDGNWEPEGSRDRTPEAVELIQTLRELFAGRQDILVTPAYDPTDADHARWLYFWSDAYKPQRPAFWARNGRDYLGDRNSLRRILEAGGSNPQRYKKRLLDIAPYLEASDDDVLAVKLSALSSAGRHCTTRAEDEMGKMYQEFKPSMAGEESLENYVAGMLSKLRRQILDSFIDRGTTHEPSHQVAHLMKRMHPFIGLLGDDDRFDDAYSFVVAPRLRDPEAPGYVTDGMLLAFIKGQYTPAFMVSKLFQQLTEDEGRSAEARKLFNRVQGHVEECQTRGLRSPEGLESTDIGSLYNEDFTGFTAAAAKAILYGLGYLENRLAEIS